MAPTPPKLPLARSTFAEFIAMALFVFVGCGSAVSTNKWNAADIDGGSLLTIAIAFGFTISYLVYAIGHISGGHINPAVTFAFFTLKKITFRKLVTYSIAQFLGAVLGVFVLWGCTASLTSECEDKPDLPVCIASEKSTPGEYGPPWGLGVNALAPRVSIGSAFLIETVGTYLLVFVVLLSAVHSKSAAGNAAPIAIGWAVMGAHIVLVPFTGCGINPARSFGPFLVNSIGGLNFWKNGWWIYFVAPYFGSGLASLTFHYIFRLHFERFAHQDEVDNGEEEDIKKTDANVPDDIERDEVQEEQAEA